MTQSNRLRHLIAILCSIFAAAALPCSGQNGSDSPIRLDPFIGYEFGRLLTLERTPGSVTWCDQCDGSGTSYNHLIRFGAALHFPKAFWGFGADMRLSLGFSQGVFTSNTYFEPIIDPNTSEIISTDRRFIVTSDAAAIAIDALLRSDLGKGWNLRFGPWGEYRILSQFIHSEEIVFPINTVFFENGLPMRVVSEGDLLGSFPLEGGLLFSISKSIPVSGRMSIAPELYTRLDGGALFNSVGFGAFSAGAGITFRLAEPERRLPDPPVMAQDMLPPSPPPVPRFELSATVDLYSLDESGTRQQESRLVPRTTLIRHRTPPTGEEILHDFHAPQIGVAPGITADAGVKWWRLEIRQGEEEIARVTSDTPDRSLDLDIDVGEGTSPAPLTAELLVEDSTGAITGARDQLAFVFDTAAMGGRGTTGYDLLEEWWKLTEEDNDFVRLSDANTRLIGEIVKAASGGAETVLFAERSSEEQKKQVEEIARLFRTRGITPTISDNFPETARGSATLSERETGSIIVVVRHSDARIESPR